VAELSKPCRSVDPGRLGEDFQLRRLQRKHKDARRGPNPQTGATIEIPERKVVRFKPPDNFKKGMLAAGDEETS